MNVRLTTIKNAKIGKYISGDDTIAKKLNFSFLSIKLSMPEPKATLTNIRGALPTRVPIK